MKRRKRALADPLSTQTAHRMADAVAYLSRVADDAGMADICADLLEIRRRLASKAEGNAGTVQGSQVNPKTT